VFSPGVMGGRAEGVRGATAEERASILQRIIYCTWV